MPALLAVSTGVLVGAVRDGSSLTGPLTFVGVVFVAVQVLTPVQQAVSANLGATAADWLHDRLMVGAVTPPGMGHLESNELAEDLSMARDFDLGMNGPPWSSRWTSSRAAWCCCVTGVLVGAVLVGFAWWAPLVLLAAWGATHRLLRESGVWKDRNTAEVRAAHRHAAYAYDLAVEPARRQGAAAVRAGRLGDRPVHRPGGPGSTSCSGEATRLRERPLVGALLVVLAGNALVFWALAEAVLDGRHRARRRDDVPPGRGRCQRGRVRRPELGAGRRGGAGRGHPAAARADGGRRAHWRRARPGRTAGLPPRRRSGSGT